MARLPGMWVVLSIGSTSVEQPIASLVRLAALGRPYVQEMVCNQVKSERPAQLQREQYYQTSKELQEAGSFLHETLLVSDQVMLSFVRQVHRSKQPQAMPKKVQKPRWGQSHQPGVLRPLQVLGQETLPWCQQLAQLECERETTACSSATLQQLQLLCLQGLGPFGVKRHC